jgi:hypothetical protein
MTEIPRRRALINGLHVQFDSRNPRLASVRWHPRFKLRYRTKADALTAKQASALARNNPGLLARSDPLNDAGFSHQPGRLLHVSESWRWRPS